MLDHILPLLIKVGRQVPVEGPPTQKEASTSARTYQSMWEDFEDSGLDWTVDREFRRTFLPNTYRKAGYGEQIAKALAKERGVKNPKPDRAYGFGLHEIPPPDEQEGLLRDETQALLNVVPGLQHVFFLIEGKSSSGDMNKAIDQACRGGAVLVRTQRLLLEAIGQDDIMSEGPDRQTYVYTATVDSSAMSFWVNFAHVKKRMPSGEKIVDYHMEHIFSCHFRSVDAELYLRRICHNILDWGIGNRRSMLESRCAKIYEAERLLIERDAVISTELDAPQSEERDRAAGTKRRKLAPGSVSQWRY